MDKHIERLLRKGRAAQSAAQSASTNVLQFRNAQEAVDSLSSQNAELRAATSVVLERMQFLRQAGITFNGARDLYEVLGYDRLITTRQYRDRYSRGGIAGRIVDAMPNATWRGTMEIVEDKDPHHDTPFEKTWKELEVKLQINAKLQRADKLAQLSTYSVILLGVQDNDLSTELPKGKPGGVLYLTPFLGGGGPGGDTRSRAAAVDADVTIMEFDVDVSSPRFGLPLYYQLRRTDISSPAFQRPVHWSRIIHLAEGILDNEVYGQPALERVWNLLDDLDKVTGGGAEAFWLRANQGLHLNIDKDMQLPAAQDAVTALKAQSEDYKHQLTRWIRTRGVDVQVLGSDVANFGPPADAILTQIAGSKSIPKRILTGSEMGELASSQDRDNWKDQINGRQTGYVGPFIVRPLVDRLIRYGYLPFPAKGEREYLVKWPQIQTLTEAEKSAGAKDWAATNQTMGTVVFTDKEIRDKWYDMKPLTDEEKDSVKTETQRAQAEAAQEALSKGGEGVGAPPPKDEEERRMLIALEEALERADHEAIPRILGITKGASPTAPMPIIIQTNSTTPSDVEALTASVKALAQRDSKVPDVNVQLVEAPHVVPPKKILSIERDSKGLLTRIVEL